MVLEHMKPFTVDISECYLRNTKLESNPTNQRNSGFYKQVLEGIRKDGMINPLTCVKIKNKYMVCLGNNRYLAAKELGLKTVEVLVVTNDEVRTLRESYEQYKDVDDFFIPRLKLQ